MDKKNTIEIEKQKLIAVFEYFEKLMESIEGQKKLALAGISACSDALTEKGTPDRESF